MGLRQRIWASKVRRRLLYLLGKKCARCGKKRKLVFDCIEPMGYKHHRQERSARMSFYTKQFWKGNLQVLCKSCNDLKAQEDILAHKEKTKETFEPF